MKKLIAAVLALTLAASLSGCVKKEYQLAQDLYNSGRHEEAKELFASLGEYKDSATKKIDCDYRVAQKAIEENRLDDAEKMLVELGDYRNCEQLLEQVRLQQKVNALLGIWATDPVAVDVTLPVANKNQPLNLPELLPWEMLEVTFSVEFYDDMTYHLVIDEARLDATIDAIRADAPQKLIENGTAKLEEVAAQRWTTLDMVLTSQKVESVEELIMKYTGVDVDTYIDKQMIILLENMLGSCDLEGTYEIEDNQLTLVFYKNSVVGTLDLDNGAFSLEKTRIRDLVPYLPMEFHPVQE